MDGDDLAAALERDSVDVLLLDVRMRSSPLRDHQPQTHVEIVPEGSSRHTVVLADGTRLVLSRSRADSLRGWRL